MLSKMEVQTHKCKFCDEEILRGDELDEHIFIHLQNQKRCEECVYIYSRRDKLIPNLLLHIREQKHECKECNKLFLEEQQVKQYLLVHMNNTSHGTHVETSIETSQPEMHRTELVSKGDEYAKHPCGQGGVNAEKYVKVENEPHRTEQSKTNGGRSSEALVKEEDMRTNMCGNRVLHLEEEVTEELGLNATSQLEVRKYECDICNKVFRSKRKLMRHTLVHTWKSEVKKENAISTTPEISIKIEESYESSVYKELILEEDMFSDYQLLFVKEIITNRGGYDQLTSNSFQEQIVHEVDLNSPNQRGQTHFISESRCEEEVITKEATDLFQDDESLIVELTEEQKLLPLEQIASLPRGVEPVRKKHDNLTDSEKKKHFDTSRKRKYECKECGRAFYKPGTLKTHMSFWHNRINCKKYESETGDCACEECDQEEAEQHDASHFQNRYKCKVCSQIFSVREEYKKHVQDHKKNKEYRKFPCEICGKVYLYKDSWKTHMSQHTGVREYKCEVCGKSYATKRVLSSHMKIHTETKNYNCEVCGKDFLLKSNYEVHMRRHRGEKNFCCEECGRLFITLDAMKLHSITHTGEKNHECNDCGKKFSQRSNLMRHIMVVHSGQKRFQCEECGKAFGQNVNLQKHMVSSHGWPGTKSDTDESEFICKVCGKRFSNKRNMQNHISYVHVGVRRRITHTCMECGKPCYSKAALEIHMVKHTRVKNYECLECHKTFLYKSSLKNHAVVHTKEKKYVCNMCGQRVTSSSNLIRHKRTHVTDVNTNVGTGDGIIIQWETL